MENSLNVLRSLTELKFNHAHIAHECFSVGFEEFDSEKFHKMWHEFFCEVGKHLTNLGFIGLARTQDPLNFDLDDPNFVLGSPNTFLESEEASVSYVFSKDLFHITFNIVWK